MKQKYGLLIFLFYMILIQVDGQSLKITEDYLVDYFVKNSEDLSKIEGKWEKHQKTFLFRGEKKLEEDINPNTISLFIFKLDTVFNIFYSKTGNISSAYFGNELNDSCFYYFDKDHNKFKVNFISKDEFNFSNEFMNQYDNALTEKIFNRFVKVK